jgi:hypothetical protein
VEGQLDGTERRTALSGGSLAHFGDAAVQTGSVVYLGRSRRCSGSVAHAEHRKHAENSFQQISGTSFCSSVSILICDFAVYHRVLEGWDVQ